MIKTLITAVLVAGLGIVPAPKSITYHGTPCNTQCQCATATPCNTQCRCATATPCNNQCQCATETPCNTQGTCNTQAQSSPAESFDVRGQKVVVDFAYRRMHLTDDQGWRAEIKIYPLLTEIGVLGELDENSEPMSFGGFIDLEKIYSMEPFEGLSEAQAKHVIGLQANLWTEYVPTDSHLEYMLLPRMLGLSSVQWSGDARPAYADFLEEVRGHQYKVLDAMGYNYKRY